MEKTARKPSADPAQEKLRQNKANWNKEVSAFVNDLIHFKKMMNGWPSKFFKERSRITQPIPADPATVIGSLAGDFQEIVNKGNSLIQEQVNYAKTRRQRQPKQLNLPLQQTEGAPATPEAPKPTAPDLSKQLQLGLAASTQRNELIKLAAEFEEKYSLESQASNPITRFITRLFNPKFGFGEGARIRRLRMTMLDNCVKSYRALKILHKEIVKSSKGSIVSSHKMMTLIWNYWNAVNRLFSTYKAIKPGEVTDQGGQIEGKELKREKDVEEGQEPGEETLAGNADMGRAAALLTLLQDYKNFSSTLNPTSPSFRELNSIVESVMAAPKDKKVTVLLNSKLDEVYKRAIEEVNRELGTAGNTFQQISGEVKTKTAQWLGEVRHKIVPGATSGSRLEISQFIEQIKQDLDVVMDLLEEGFDQKRLAPAIAQVNREMSALRTMVRSLYYSEKPEEAPSFF